MNRPQRRAAEKAKRAETRALVSAINAGGRVPVFGADNRVVALVRKQDVRYYETAPNAVVTRDPANGEVRITLGHLSDDTSMIVHRGNPRRYSHDHETSDNPARVWTMRKLAHPDTTVDLFVRAIYRASVLDNLKDKRRDNRRDNVRALPKPKMSPRPATKAA